MLGEKKDSLVGLLQEAVPVADGKGHEAYVDEVESAGAVDPVGFDVVDFEGDVRRDPAYRLRKLASPCHAWDMSPSFSRRPLPETPI